MGSADLHMNLAVERHETQIIIRGKVPVQNLLSPPEGELSSSPRSPDGDQQEKSVDQSSTGEQWGGRRTGCTRRERKASAIALP